jgi:DeoR/GlpR family transcriptional regulator of sugar metabolism
MIGNGTSTLEVVRNLHSHPNVTIVTHSTPVLLLAMEMFPGRIIFVGGEVNRHQRSVSGPLSELVLNRLRVNKAFISAGGVSLVDGITDYEISEANISRIMIERADEAIILADHSKLGKTTFANICSLDDVFTVITDHRCPPEWIRYLAERDVELIVADEEEGE